MRIKLYFITLLFLIKFCYGFSFPSNITFNFNSFSISNFLDISGSSFFNEDTKINLKNHMFLTHKDELKLSIKDMEIGAIFFSDYYGYMENSTLDFVKGLINNNLSIGDYDIYGEIKGYSIGGIFIKRSINLGNFLSLFFTPKLYIGFDYQNGVLSGNFSRIDEETYSFDLFLNYIYNNNLLYRRIDMVKGKGIGYSFDFGILFNLLKNLSFSLNIEDLGGRVYWFDIPYTNAKASSDREYVDENGYIAFRPLISGYEGYKDYVQFLPLKLDINIGYKGERNNFILELSFKDDYNSLYIKYCYILSNNKKISQFKNERFNIIDSLSPSGFYLLFFIDNYQFFNLIYGISLLM